MKKKFPTFKTDQEAEDFVATADLTEYDFSDFVPMKFELKPKDKTINLRLPTALRTAIYSKARKAGIPAQRFMRMALEKAVR